MKFTTVLQCQNLFISRKYLCATVFMMLLVASFIKELNSLRVVALRVPSKVKVDTEKVDLMCLYDLEFDKALLTLSWWFMPNVTGAHEMELYRYSAQETEKDKSKQSFPIDGLNVNLEKSSAGKMTLTNITMKAAGTYICKVEAAETGAHDKDDKAMLVYDPSASANRCFLNISLLFISIFVIIWNQH